MFEERDRKSWQLRMARTRAKRLEDFENFITLLHERDMFDANAFKDFRSRSKSQAEWAEMIGVAQGTIGNWERGNTYPNKTFRKLILDAAYETLQSEKQKAQFLTDILDVKLEFNPEVAQSTMEESILRAALTDFDYDSDREKIVSIPFKGDSANFDSSEFQEDRDFLLDALSQQTDIICDDLSDGANAETDYLIKYLKRYKEQCIAEKINPRLIYRLGDTIKKKASDDDVRLAISGWNEQAFDGFVSDHQELMRLYYREALAKAQEVEAAQIDEVAGDVGADTFYDTADLLETAKNTDGSSVYDRDIITLLRDIGKEVEEISDKCQFTIDAKRKQGLKQRRKEAIKNGSIYVGRILFFSSIFVVMTAPPSLGAVGSIASILGLIEAVSSGSILSIYERCRAAFPLLPKFQNISDQ